MQPTSLPATLPAMSTREAITDAIYRATEAFDTGDFALLKSAMTLDARFEVDGHVMNSLDEIKKTSFDHVGAMDTTHHVTNVRITFDGDDPKKAKATATFLAQHYPKGKGGAGEGRRILVGGKYYAELIRDDEDGGLWKSRDFLVKPVWREGDMSVMMPS